jgi:hypothetical protein
MADCNYASGGNRNDDPSRTNTSKVTGTDNSHVDNLNAHGDSQVYRRDMASKGKFSRICSLAAH